MSRVLLGAEGRDEPVLVDVQRGSAGDGGGERCVVRVGDDDHAQTVEVEVRWSGAGGGFLRMGGAIVPFFVTRADGRILVWLRGRTHALTLVERTARRATEGEAAGASADLTAPMPGTILKINTQPGASFAAHEALIVLESMKMELALSSPQPGRVREVLCREGELVEMGALLVRLESPE